MYVRASVHHSVIFSDHNLYIYSWISKQVGTVVALEKEKCYLKHFLGRLKIKVTGFNKGQNSQIIILSLSGA